MMGITRLVQREQFDQLDKKHDQHHLASLLCAVAAGQPGYSRVHIDQHLDAYSANRFDRKLRLDHAIDLACRSVPELLASKLRSLASELD